jgi:hypothetical protein
MRAGLLLILLALMLPAIDRVVDLASSDELDTWKGHVFTVALSAFGLALVLAIFEKAGMKVAGARCRDCKKRIPHGHAYCFDHLMSRQDKARNRMHGQRGLGV